MLSQCMYTATGDFVCGARRKTPQTEAFTNVCAAKRPKNKKETALVNMAQEKVEALFDSLRYASLDQYSTSEKSFLNAFRNYIRSFRNVEVRITHDPNITTKFCVPKILELYFLVNPSNAEVHNSERLNTKILHELARFHGNGYDAQWQRGWSVLMKFANNEMGWTCALKCEACQKYGMCHPEICAKQTGLCTQPCTTCVFDYAPNQCAGPYWRVKS